MANELQIFSADILSPEDVSELDKHIEATINAHKNNRQAINRLVFESVAAITEGERYKEQLSNKGWFSIFVGSITGSNRRLQNKINSSYLAAQYAGQLTMQRLAERNLLSFDLIAVLHNKLYASLSRIDAEFNNVYKALSIFLKQNRSDMIQLENRIKKLERNVNLLNWQSSIEFQMFDGVEYAELSDIAKIVCLVRDFLDITEGNYSTSDLLLFKSAMSEIGIAPKAGINYFEAIKCIDNNPKLKAKLLGNTDLATVSFDESLIFIEGLKKLELLSTDEKYIVDSVLELSPKNDFNTIKTILTRNFIANIENVDLDIEVPVFDFLMELVYNINQLSHLKINVFTEKLLTKKSLTEILEEANILYDKKDYSVALNLFLELSEANIPDAQNKLGDFYKNGYGVEKNFTEAFKYYTKAANQGLAIAQFNLGYMYEHGEGVEVNYNKAIKWYRDAANQGLAIAQNKLGDFYKNGYDLEINFTEAFKYYTKAANQGLAIAKFNLGYMYEYGKGVEADYTEAIKLYRDAADQGFDRAQTKLGDMYFHCRGVSLDYHKAFYWYKKAAEQGYAPAQYQIAVFYQHGYGIEKDISMAIKWYRKASEQGNKEATHELEKLGIYR